MGYSLPHYLSQSVNNESVDREVDEPLVLGVEPQLNDVQLGDPGGLKLQVDVPGNVEVAVGASIAILVALNNRTT